MKLPLLLAIAAGGAVGALGRHFAAGQAMKLLGTGFPWGTLLVNVLGSFIMGVLIEVFARFFHPSQELRAFLVVGLLGAFTTFSTFSLDVGLLHGRGELGLAALYVIVSVSLSIAALFFGFWLIRNVPA
ncbi:camphor resistance protein CrcB [Tistlia consotensis]|uniref:Fluoride-specific ion channel FluC n=1 Tax=Tistlia consotensis USBA 355 TaxID=560819 RepID=A0A1Y6C926_9PROT|nr:fluoride efflux transporter CrcB [Tistlia consotensis]SMF43138.1 camphor resistance protein CrcB [Tistlia consotensis USBA 355]SNR42275.1 camphor resistance protein CrcB [Tistlia consotensis]